MLGISKEYKELVWNLTSRDMKSRYRGSILGLLWTILNPLFMAIIYIFFLRLLAGRGSGIGYEDVIIGVFAWQYTVQCVNAGLSAFTGNANLVKKVFFPRIILPVSVVFSQLINFLLTLVVQLALVAILLGIRGEWISGWVMLLPLVLIWHTLFNLALTLVVSSANVYYRDTQHIVGLLLSAWFFMSPVMYTLSVVNSFTGLGPWLKALYVMNPLSVIITAYRACLVPTEAFPGGWAVMVGWGLPVVLLGITLCGFKRAQKYFADVL